jgi:hypothetical protein
MKPRLLNNQELADLSDNWENARVDTRRYYQNVLRAYEVDETTFIQCKADGDICQAYKFRYYVAY